MEIKYLFQKYFELDDMLGGHLLEMSVKQHQITFRMDDSLLEFPYIKVLLDLYTNNESYVTTHEDSLYFVIGGLSLELLDNTILYPFLDTITEMAKTVCTCPSLEFNISHQYLKCFLDKPVLKIEDLSKYEKVLNAKGEAELELHPQRPYLLFINMYTTESILDTKTVEE